MARAVFRPGEVEYLTNKVVLDAPFPEIQEATQDVDESIFEEYTGPTPDELRREAEKFKADFAIEKAEMEKAAQAQAEAIVEDARVRAKQIAGDAETAAAARLEQADAEAAKRQSETDAAAAATAAAAGREAETLRKQGYDEGIAHGREEGFTQGMAEVQRLIARTQTVLERIQDKRASIVSETEQQLIDLTLLVARKVVKSISESHKDVVIENIREALGKVKAKGKALVKVNLSDLELSSAHIENFTTLIEGGGGIQILEDSTVDAGGCIVETDFGEIDARISTQFAELEAKIRELSPVKSQ
ncbi:MAG: flagellar assembly protein FliH [Spirochaetaceae bacterium]|jgi:flagellar assembly protein FliH|nr:flagellar assembly protein FliH [Spirochaetaceae bacterium]